MYEDNQGSYQGSTPRDRMGREKGRFLEGYQRGILGTLALILALGLTCGALSMLSEPAWGYKRERQIITETSPSNPDSLEVKLQMTTRASEE